MWFSGGEREVCWGGVICCGVHKKWALGFSGGGGGDGGGRKWKRGPVESESLS